MVNIITGTFLYLDAGVSYKIIVRVWIGTYFKDCTFTTVETTGGGGYTITYTNTGHDADPIALVIGNNNSSPTTTIYAGDYDTDPISGTDVNLPAVNANVVFEIGTGGGKTLLSANCNGIPGVTGTSTASWSGVNGAINITFVTD